MILSTNFDINFKNIIKYYHLIYLFSHFIFFIAGIELKHLIFM